MLAIGFRKHASGAVTLRCRRADGTESWQSQTKHAAHFVLHDLTHLAVEIALAYRNGFFGLIVQGWDIDETTGKGKRGELPAEAREVERLVGLFDAERGSGVLWSVDEFNEFAPRLLSEEEIQSIRQMRGALFQKWFALGVDEALLLQF